MSSGNVTNLKRDRTFSVVVSKEAAGYLRNLSRTGLHGDNPEEVIRIMVNEALIALIDADWVPADD